jgi:hypothetical protein
MHKIYGEKFRANAGNSGHAADGSDRAHIRGNTEGGLPIGGFVRGIGHNTGDDWALVLAGTVAGILLSLILSSH